MDYLKRLEESVINFEQESKKVSSITDFVKVIQKLIYLIEEEKKVLVKAGNELEKGIDTFDNARGMLQQEIKVLNEHVNQQREDLEVFKLETRGLFLEIQKGINIFRWGIFVSVLLNIWLVSKLVF